jgi:hypothetical protein
LIAGCPVAVAVVAPGARRPTPAGTILEGLRIERVLTAYRASSLSADRRRFNMLNFGSMRKFNMLNFGLDSKIQDAQFRPRARKTGPPFRASST